MKTFNRLTTLFIIVLVAFALTGCTTMLGPAGDSWIGAPVDEFIFQAGVPEKTMELQDGRIAYTWSLGCNVTIIAREGIIENWSSTNCLSIHPVPGKWKRKK